MEDDELRFKTKVMKNRKGDLGKPEALNPNTSTKQVEEPPEDTREEGKEENQEAVDCCRPRRSPADSFRKLWQVSHQWAMSPNPTGYENQLKTFLKNQEAKFLAHTS